MSSPTTIAPPRADWDTHAFFELVVRSFNFDRSRLDRMLDVVGSVNPSIARIGADCGRARAQSWLAPNDPSLDLTPERAWSSGVSSPWGLRLTHVPLALDAHGYARSLSGTLHLRAYDDVVQGYDDAFVLEF